MIGALGRGCAGDGDAEDSHFCDAVKLLDGRLDVRKRDAGDADQPLRGVAAVVADPIVVTFEDCVRNLAVGVGEGEHVEAGVHHLSDDPVGRLFLEALDRIEDAGVHALPALGDELLGLRVVQAVPGDAEATDGDGEVCELEESAGAAAGISEDLRRPLTEAVEPLKDLRCLYHVGIA